MTVISVENLSKVYRLGAIGSTTLREDLSRGWARLLGKPDPTLKVGQPHHERREAGVFWALRDINFEVKRGEALGIIGKNGAGKSTLLKILSRITAPTQGSVKIKGRVASLLEVGTGFHPDLTGRENIFLNGAILGMSKAEIRKKFDEIVDFSGVEEFIDTPVKRYSSGMYVRLAFGVAAHLDPEILILDEVLAVGDAEFQKKCLGKMDEVAKGGRTILFVSHNMGAIANLCSRVLLCSHGSKVKDGDPQEVISSYVKSLECQTGSIEWNDPKRAPGNENVRLKSVHVTTRSRTTGDVNIDEDVDVCLEFWNFKPGLRLHSSIHLLNSLGVEVFATSNFPSATPTPDEWFGRPYPVGVFRSVCTIPANFLNEGIYSIRAALCSDVSCIELLTNEIVSFTVHESGAMRKEYVGQWIGVVRPKLAWRTERLSDANEIPPLPKMN